MQLSQFLQRNRDALLPVALICILLTMVIPLPARMIDLLLTVSITAGVLTLFIAIYTNEPLEFSAYPSLLLILTLFRLSLNIATTRRILLFGHEGSDAAGHLIETFGNFVVGGNYVVGVVIFLILVVVNYMVIVRGSVRIGEVSARFTLDAMPGKQMSIDADLNAGLINEEQARQRRSKIEQEADFYGAMDGASRFVRGDAVAGILITLINIMGGLIIGVFQHDLLFSEAAKNYTLLTIGDGLLSQIPSLIISTSAGLIVTRAGSERSSLGEALTKQLLIQPRALLVSGFVLLFIMLVPGMPKMPFIVLGSLCIWIANRTMAASRTRLRLADEARERAAQQAQAAPKEEREALETLLPLDPIALEVGYALIALVDAEQNGELLERIKSVRRQFALEMGYVVPPIHIRDNLELQPGGYSFLIKGCEVARGVMMPNHLLAMAPEEMETRLDGIATTEPAFGLPALWIGEKDREAAQAEGMTVVDHATVIATHLTEVLRTHAAELLGRQETQGLLDTLAKKFPKMLEGVVPDILTLGQIQKVLQNLLRERVSIRDLQTILETMIDRSPATSDPDYLTEFVRQALARNITQQHLSDDGKLYVMMLDQEIEEHLARATQQTDAGRILAIEPRTAQSIINAIQHAMESFTMLQAQPIVACLPAVRLQLRKLTEKFFPSLVIISHSEIAPNTPIESVGIVRLANAG
ncbi:MAG: Flagellar biosynthesis protein FlhA [candidate division BRC1 bacterium ADurb.BinA364]|nr:MAG: Flagellar biosynthesis protein FlhA [candidate division BRC1 bacterium ADurb.BinA364]